MIRLLKFLLWFGIALLGAGAVAIAAFARGEPINALWIVTAGLCATAISYRFYSKWLAAKVLVLNDERATPALVVDDGKDFVPTNRWMAFGHHFAAIAGPGPLVGPVLAAQFGYLPGMLWILIGATLGGGVHDMIVLFASVRRQGKTLGQMVKEEIGSAVGTLALISVLAIMVILLAVLALVVVQALAKSPWGVFTIAMTIPVAVIMGISLRGGRVGVGWVTVFGLLGLLFSVWGGQFLAQYPALESWFRFDQKSLAWALMFYGFAASALPVWLLLTPRDYLRTFLKLGTVAALAVAVIVIHPTLQMPALTRFIDGTGLVFAGPVFPFVCITIACGAVSGFHSLIASGTTPKMIESETRIRDIGYGAMVTEMMVALMALVAASVLPPGQYFAINAKGAPGEVVATVSAAGFPVTEPEMKQLATELGESTMFNRAGGAPTFAVGMAHMFSRITASPTALALWYHFAIMFEALFILTTLDAGTRVGRFLLQDLLGQFWRPLGQHRVVEREYCHERAARRSVGLVPLPGCARSVRRDQQSLAALRPGQSTTLGHRALPRDDDPDQDGQSALPLDHARAARLHDRGHVFRRLSQDLVGGSENRFPQWSQHARREVGGCIEHRRFCAAGFHLADRCAGGARFPGACFPDCDRLRPAMVAAPARDETDRAARKRVCSSGRGARGDSLGRDARKRNARRRGRAGQAADRAFSRGGGAGGD